MLASNISRIVSAIGLGLVLNSHQLFVLTVGGRRCLIAASANSPRELRMILVQLCLFADPASLVCGLLIVLCCVCSLASFPFLSPEP